MKFSPSMFVRLSALVLAGTLAACGGNSHAGSGALVPTATAGKPVLAMATFVFTVPKSTQTLAHATSQSLRPLYVSSATKSFQFSLTAATAGLPSPNNPSVINVPNGGGGPGAPCVSAGANFQCTLTVAIPPGNDGITLTSYDQNNGAAGGGNVLSQQNAAVTVVAGVANGPGGAFSITLDANAATLAIGAASGFCAGSVTIANNGSFGTVGTTPVTFSATYTDPAAKTIVAPGLPLLRINGSATSGTITGTNGNVTFTINQATQSYTLAATTNNTIATVNVSATPANSTGGSDGLAFSRAISYTFQSGPAPPPSFLADAEQIFDSNGVVTGGVIHLFTLALGASDTFTPYATPSLTNQSNDVDFPNDVLFDTQGDLLIANGGSGNPDFGNFACVPAGAIATGANAATVLATNLDDPISIARGSDNSVALGNGAGNAPFRLVEFTLSGNYTAAPVARDIPASSFPTTGVNPNVVALPTTAANPAGTYAVVITDGTTQAGNHVVIKRPDGSSVQLATDPDDIDTFMTYDPQNDQIVLASSNGTSSHITFWAVSSLSKVKDFVIENDGAGNSQAKALGPIASSADGHIALAVTGQSGFPELIVYDNTSSRNKIGATLDYGATTTGGGATFVYGGFNVSANVINGMRWLSNTKLLVPLESQRSHIATSAQGMYVYDITQTQAQGGFDVNGTAEPTPTVKQTGFQALSNSPLAATFKP